MPDFDHKILPSAGAEQSAHVTRGVQIQAGGLGGKAGGGGGIKGDGGGGGMGGYAQGGHGHIAADVVLHARDGPSMAVGSSSKGWHPPYVGVGGSQGGGMAMGGCGGRGKGCIASDFMCDYGGSANGGSGGNGGMALAAAGIGGGGSAHGSALSMGGAGGGGSHVPDGGNHGWGSDRRQGGFTPAVAVMPARSDDCWDGCGAVHPSHGAYDTVVVQPSYVKPMIGQMKGNDVAATMGKGKGHAADIGFPQVVTPPECQSPSGKGTMMMRMTDGKGLGGSIVMTGGTVNGSIDMNSSEVGGPPPPPTRHGYHRQPSTPPLSPRSPRPRPPGTRPPQHLLVESVCVSKAASVPHAPKAPFQAMVPPPSVNPSGWGPY